jgi:hypothetical protein
MLFNEALYSSSYTYFGFFNTETKRDNSRTKEKPQEHDLQTWTEMCKNANVTTCIRFI